MTDTHEPDSLAEETTGAADGYLSPENLPPVATVQEIARFLRVRPNLIYSMHRRGEIPGGKRVGRSIRFSSRAVVDWLAAGEPRTRRRA